MQCKSVTNKLSEVPALGLQIRNPVQNNYSNAIGPQNYFSNPKQSLDPGLGIPMKPKKHTTSVFPLNSTNSILEREHEIQLDAQYTE